MTKPRRPLPRYITYIDGRAKPYRVAVPRPAGALRRTTHHRTLDQAKIQLELDLTDLENGRDHGLAKGTFGDIARKYIEKHGARTRKTVVLNLQNHVIPRWDTVPIGIIQTKDVNDWLPTITSKRAGRTVPLKPSSVHAIYSAFRCVFKWAQEEGYVHSSPCVPRMSGLPSVQPNNAEFDPEVWLNIYRHVHPHYQVPILVAAMAGLRTGEIRGLQPADITPTDILVRRQLVNRSNRRAPVVEPPKAGSAGDVPIPPVLYDRLVTYMAEEFVSTPDSYGFLFTTTRGRYLDGWTLLRKWQQARELAGVDEGYETVHGLRSLAISMLLAQIGKAHLPEIQAFARHKHLATTFIYTKRMKGGDDKVREGMADAYRDLL